MGPMNLKAVEMLVSDAIALSQRMTQNDPGRVVKNALNQNFISALFPQREGRVKEGNETPRATDPRLSGALDIRTGGALKVQTNHPKVGANHRTAW